MLKFRPPNFISDYIQYLNTPFCKIPEAVWEGIYNRIASMQNDEPYVSIVLIAYNEQEFLSSTLLSISNLQSVFPLEIIVVNNNSTDKTQDIIDRSGAISVFEKSQGYSHARQAGLKRARGKYVISGDADTLYPPGWVDAMILPMEKDQEIVCTYSRFRFYKEDEKYTIGLNLYEQARTIDIWFKDYKRPHLNVRGFSMAFRKSVAEQVGGYNTELTRGSDGYLGIELLDLGKIKLVNNRNAVVYTNMRRAMLEGGLLQNFKKRFFNTLRYFFHMFTPQKDR